jgi:hypothetical protein
MLLRGGPADCSAILRAGQMPRQASAWVRGEWGTETFGWNVGLIFRGLLSRATGSMLDVYGVSSSSEQPITTLTLYLSVHLNESIVPRVSLPHRGCEEVGKGPNAAFAWEMIEHV